MQDLPEQLLIQRTAVAEVLGSHWWQPLLAASGKWLFDYLTLVFALAAVGARPNVALVLVAYSAVSFVGRVPRNDTPRSARPLTRLLERGAEQASDEGAVTSRRQAPDWGVSQRRGQRWAGSCDPAHVATTASGLSAPGEHQAVGARRDGSAVVQVLQVISDLLLEVGDSAPEDAFLSRLCEAICYLAAMRRAVLFRYDATRRRVRVAGAHAMDGVNLEDLFVTIESVPVVKQALALDRVLETVGADDFDVPATLRETLAGVRIICTPMAAAGSSVGVVLSEREYDAPPLTDADRQLLWTLGKSIAMASVAREAVAHNERSRQLEHRIDLARDLHEEVVQRLFGVSLALSRNDPLDAETQRRCAAEVQAALGELRTALQRPLGHSSRPTGSTFIEEIERQRALSPELDIELEGNVEDVPAGVGDLTQSLLAEAVRNARKHARTRTVKVRLSAEAQTFVMEVENDGVVTRERSAAGMGLHLVTLEALQRGGVLEYGEGAPGHWVVRLVVPAGDEQ